MVALLKIAVHLLADVLRFVILVFRTSQSIQSENLFLRRQLPGLADPDVREASALNSEILGRTLQPR
jgi:hypothetical protein